MPDSAVAEPVQKSLFNLAGKEFNAYWVDESQPLFIPDNPLHWKAHKLQVLLEILTKQATKNPAQFNSKNYLDTLDGYTRAVEQIKNGGLNENLGSGELDSKRATDKSSAAMGSGDATGMDIGVSADNPFARQGTDPA